MGFIDEFKKWAKIEADDEDDEFEEFPAPRRSSRRDDDFDDAFESRRSNKDKVVNIHTTTQLQVVLVKAERYDNSTEIADHLKERRTVVLNLETTNKDVARRVLDFLSGVAYAIGGRIQRVANNTFIITPYNVDLKGDLIDELENNGLYF